METSSQNVSAGTTVKPKRKKIKFSFRPQVQWQERQDKWLSFYPNFHKLSFTISSSSYFDERVEIHSCLTTVIALLGFSLSAILPLWTLWMWSVLFLVPWGQFFLSLPIYSGKNECEYDKYGFYLYGLDGWWRFDCFVWCWRKTHYYDMPWRWIWVRTSELRKDGSWKHERTGDSKRFYLDKWKEVIWHESYPYRYVLLDGGIQDVMADLKVVEREWRWKWAKWSSFPRRISKVIDISFSDEVGPARGSWKGGVLGCSYEMKHGELPEQTLRRMEKERRFER